MKQDRKKYYISMPLILFLICLVFSDVKAQTNGEMSDARQAIEQVNKKFMQAWANGDDAGVTSLYTDDALFLAPHFEPMQGREAVAKYIQGGMNAGLKQIKLETTEFVHYGNIAHEIGRYELYTADNQLADYGKYVVIWKRENGTWKLHRDMMNTSKPRPEKESSEQQ